jgi:hypothetical protein
MKIISLLLMIVILLPTVLADGMVVDYYDRHWHIHNEKQQLAAINYQNGYQDMILSIDINEVKGEKAVWMFPVPASPEKTVIDIVDEFPQFHGLDIERRAELKIRNMFDDMRLTQLYPILYPRRWYIGGPRVLEVADTALAKSTGGVIVHEHIEKYGLTTELVSTEDGIILWNYLALKGLELPEESKKVMNDYIGEDYSFVVSWISDKEEYQKEEIQKNHPYYGIKRIGVKLMFPTDKIYFPLKPTSVYGSKRVPALIYVMGHVTPELYPEIEFDSEVKYYTYEGRYYPELTSFFKTTVYPKGMDYTLININPPSKFLTRDLWIEEKAPANVVRTKFIGDHIFGIGIIAFVLSSIMASLFAGLIFFRKDVSKRRLALFGLWNFLTIIGVIIAAVFLKTKEIDDKLRKLVREKGLVVRARDVRKIGFVIVFSIFFLVITYIIGFLLKLLI